MKYPKLRELKEAVKALIFGPCTTKFPAEPHIPPKGFRGRPVPSEKDCIGCGACAEVCPAVAIEVKDDLQCFPPTRSLTWNYDLCIFCGQCERVCSVKTGVVLSDKEFDLAVLDRKQLKAGVKKELVVCECGTVIAPKDQILSIARRLGEMSYGNFLVFSKLHVFSGLNESYQSQDHPSVSRRELFEVVCPKCRRKHHLFDEYGPSKQS